MRPHEAAPDRKSYLGGSDISAIVGADPYASPLTVYERKLGLAPKDEPTSAMLRGIFFEDGVAKWYARREDKYLGSEGVTPPHPFFPFLRGNYDRLVLEGKSNSQPVAVLECKTANMRQAHKWGDPDDLQKKVPVNYYLQATYYAGLLGLSRFVIAAYLAWKDDLAVYGFDLDQSTFDALVEAGARFWNDHVLAGVPPPPELGRSTQDDLVRLYPEGSGEIVEAPDAVLGMWEAAEAAYRKKKEAEAVLQEFKVACQFVAGDASAVRFPDGVVKIQDKKGVPRYKDLAADFARKAGCEPGTDAWNEAVRAATGRGTRYALLPFGGEE